MTRLLRAVLAPASALALCCAPVAAEPAIWKASDADSDVWLFGSIHALDADTAWQSELLMQAVSEADYFYYEIPGGPQTEPVMAEQLSAHGLVPQGTTLSRMLNDSQKATFDRVAEKMGLSRRQLDPYMPWLAYVTIAVTQIQQAGYSPDSGVDTTMQALTDDTQERYLETIPQQVGFFAGMPLDLQIDLLMTSLEQIEQDPGMLDLMITAWKEGDAEQLDIIVNQSLAELNDKVYQTLIVRRNKAWVEEISTLIDESDEDAVIIVGAGHMVGKDGLPTLLKKRGFTVERVQ